MRIFGFIEARSQEPEARIRRRSGFWLLASGSWLLIGCAATKPTTQPATWADQAQADPADFDPRMDNPDISGGGISHFDKNAFDKDVNDVLNP